MLNIHILNIKDVKINKEKIIEYIDSERRKKALRYKHEEDILRSLASSYFIKKYVGDITYNKYGKPLSDKKYFNISHANEYIVYVEDIKPIGIDIEFIRDIKDDLINYSLNDSEIKSLKDKSEFYYFWTKKEAIVKLKGGTLNDIKNIIENNKDINTITIKYDNNYYLSIASLDKNEIRVINEKID